MSKMTLKEREAHLKKLIEHGESIKTDKALVDDILRDHLCNIPHKKLYKFRTCSNQNFNVLNDECIWMPPASTFMDTFDCTINIDFEKNLPKIKAWIHESLPALCFSFIKDFYAAQGIEFPFSLDDVLEYDKRCLTPSGKIKPQEEYDFLKQHASEEELKTFDEQIQSIRKYRADFEEKVSARMETLAKDFVEALNKTRSHLRDTMLVYCMTERLENNKLWETYSDNYTGFCIEYNFENFEEVGFDIYKNLIYLLPMIYRKRIPYFDIVSFIDVATRKSLLHEDGLEQNPDLLTALNMQMFYKDKVYESEYEWRFSIKNNNNNIQPFPFVSGIYAGKNIKPRNLQRLKNIAKRLEVPLYCQKANESNNGYVYILTQEVNR